MAWSVLLYRSEPGTKERRLTNDGNCGRIGQSNGGSQSSESECREIMQTKTAKFTFAIPEGHPQQGQKIEKTFDYNVCDNDTEATSVIVEKKWSLVGLVNDQLKANARSNAYQAALLPYKPSEVSPEDIKERMVRDYIRLGVPEDMARAQVESLLANK